MGTKTTNDNWALALTAFRINAVNLIAEFGQG